ncbi:hypothetical protein JG687_00019688 [Phytophthora cactorum]|uniref:Carboxylesterase type B domain-containing protein n=1 Tax=Phytophthora cactorum TaxID=29920 RepID=A0A329R8J1_9STRA|nr:hypothetical protein Pcac1_g872 [Phytophthora cactorum]KAG2803832.1 hypothetical protein PC111_g18522 [Phytophthora cactorum]KAG2821864.1 hypothetical protein PC112_g11199 [Phytophthora cactorum]KAG2851118.1 hypothetical protein PC113_g16183 [Phytophthora cactorum]KAG2889859.1 hypothetical protein PC114_g17755 [Phytophthora cactorum]
MTGVSTYQRVIDNTTSATSSSIQASTSSASSSTSLPTVGYYKYQNIRFARVTTGDLRFTAPEWPDIETAINTGNLADADVGYKTSEDCLYLDVWAPADAVGRNLPVMVWTYGGGFTDGSKSGVTPEGLFDLSTDFVYVAYNYRVGITGLANGPTYQHEGGVANLCVWDSEHAFEWVQKCISSFGGNPNDVTAVGFSAGGSQVMFQMTRFGGRAPQLFHKAYIMSPGYVPGAGHYHAEQFWQNVSSSLGCDGDTARVDGFIIPDTYEANLYQGHFNFSGPCVISHALHEVNSRAYSGGNTQEDVSAYLRIVFPGISDDAVETLLELYPEENYESAGLRFADMKQSFELADKNIALTHALNNQTWNAEVALGDATHGADQNYYWYSTYTLNTSSNSSSDTETLSAAEAAGVGAVTTTVNATIAVAMQKYLVSFVLTGNPNSVWPEDNIYWPMFNESSVGTQVVFNDTFTVADDDLASAQSIFWNKALWY